MHHIEMDDVTDEFFRCWDMAAKHLESKADGQINSWIRAIMMPPFLEHLSLRLGNQLFFIRIESVDGQVRTPGNPDGLLTIADGCQGHACLMPMQLIRGEYGGQWQPVESGWGLIDARTRLPINPVALVTDELIEMTDWELQDFAVQVVRDHLLVQGREIMSFNRNPAVHPSIWFVGDDGPEWVSVGVVRYPLREAPLPANLSELRTTFNRTGRPGHFASVAVANTKDPFDPNIATNGKYLPLYRGHGMYVNFTGLEPIVSLRE